MYGFVGNDGVDSWDYLGREPNAIEHVRITTRPKRCWSFTWAGYYGTSRESPNPQVLHNYVVASLGDLGDKSGPRRDYSMILDPWWTGEPYAVASDDKDLDMFHQWNYVHPAHDLVPTDGERWNGTGWVTHHYRPSRPDESLIIKPRT